MISSNRCGSCWAFSASQTFESHLAIKTNTPVQELSTEQILSCAPNPDECGGKGKCDGSTQPLAFDYTKTVGLTTEKNWPYTGWSGTVVCEDEKYDKVAYNTGYTILPTNDYTALMDAVANVGPVAISLAGASNGFQFYGGGVLSECNDYVMNHAVQLVGYGSDNGKMYWLVRNSWGADWGENGYIRIERHGEGREPCGVDDQPHDGDACKGDDAPRTYCGECAILSASSYPTGFTSVQPPPSPPTPPPPPAPLPRPSPMPSPSPSPSPSPTPSPGPLTPGNCMDGNIGKQQCESRCDEKTGEPCLWCGDHGFLPCVTKKWGCDSFTI